MRYFPHFLLVTYLAAAVWLGIDPYDRGAWLAENGIILAIVGAILVLFVRGVRFSNLSYALMAVLVFWNVVGAHYTFARVPFDWFNELFGFERNMYDRVGHFFVGFYAYPIAEYMTVRALANKKWLVYAFSFAAIVTASVFYELIEWSTVLVAPGNISSMEFIGAQGDFWDAQKDFVFDIAGAAFALILFAAIYKKQTE